MIFADLATLSKRITVPYRSRLVEFLKFLEEATMSAKSPWNTPRKGGGYFITSNTGRSMSIFGV